MIPLSTSTCFKVTVALYATIVSYLDVSFNMAFNIIERQQGIHICLACQTGSSFLARAQGQSWYQKSFGNKYPCKVIEAPSSPSAIITFQIYQGRLQAAWKPALSMKQGSAIRSSRMATGRSTGESSYCKLCSRAYCLLPINYLKLCFFQLFCTL